MNELTPCMHQRETMRFKLSFCRYTYTYALIRVMNMWIIFGQAIVIHNIGVASEPFCNDFQEATLRAVLAQLQCLTN